jgi:hypothetical protein
MSILFLRRLYGRHMDKGAEQGAFHAVIGRVCRRGVEVGCAGAGVGGVPGEFFRGLRQGVGRRIGYEQEEAGGSLGVHFQKDADVPDARPVQCGYEGLLQIGIGELSLGIASEQPGAKLVPLLCLAPVAPGDGYNRRGP